MIQRWVRNLVRWDQLKIQRRRGGPSTPTPHCDDSRGFRVSQICGQSQQRSPCESVAYDLHAAHRLPHGLEGLRYECFIHRLIDLQRRKGRNDQTGSGDAIRCKMRGEGEIHYIWTVHCTDCPTMEISAEILQWGHLIKKEMCPYFLFYIQGRK